MLTKKRIHIRKHMIYPTMPISTPFKKFELLFLLSDLVDFFVWSIIGTTFVL